jgi:hypothetical protein
MLFSCFLSIRPAKKVTELSSNTAASRGLQCLRLPRMQFVNSRFIAALLCLAALHAAPRAVPARRPPIFAGPGIGVAYRVISLSFEGRNQVIPAPRTAQRPLRMGGCQHLEDDARGIPCVAPALSAQCVGCTHPIVVQERLRYPAAAPRSTPIPHSI